MKIEAIVGPSRLEEVKRVLAHQWIAGLTVTEVKGSSGGGLVERYRGVERQAELTPLLRIEIVVPAPLLPRLLHDLTRWLRTGREDDGMLIVGPVDEAIRVRTGERGEGAL
jgi:nitrogen regulatory protein P-II 1